MFICSKARKIKYSVLLYPSLGEVIKFTEGRSEHDNRGTEPWMHYNPWFKVILEQALCAVEIGR